MDTGNLKFNAIKVHGTQDGFVITYDTNIAPYVAWLEDNAKSPHKGFIGVTGNAILSYMNAELGGIKTNINSSRARVIADAKSNPARMMRFLDSVNGTHLKNEEEL